MQLSRLRLSEKKIRPPYVRETDQLEFRVWNLEFGVCGFWRAGSCEGSRPECASPQTVFRSFSSGLVLDEL